MRLPFYPIQGYSAPMSPRILAVSGMLLVSLALPAAAQALPTIQPLKPCYVTAGTPDEHQSEPVQITAAGFTPNSKVDLTIDGVAVEGGTGLQTDVAGNLPIPPNAIAAPYVQSGIVPFTVTLTEQGNPVNTVSATSKSTALGVTVKPTSARPSDLIRFKGLGFTQDKPVYAHYLRKGKLRKTVRMERRPGECGSFKARRRQIPIDDPGLGKWIVQFDQSKRYVNPAVTPIIYVRLGIMLRLVPG
jgi:hypothetical protein